MQVCNGWINLKFTQLKRKTASAKTKFQSFTDNYFPKNNIEMYTYGV